MSLGKKSVATFCAVALLSVAGVATANNKIKIQGSGGGQAKIDCPGGMSRLGHAFDENMSIFPYDPAVHIENLYTVADDFFKVEDIDTGTHAGTHIDVPAHFIDGGRTLDQLAADEFLWPAYKIDMRDMTLAGDQLTVADIQAFEAQNGRIRRGSLVVLQTGAEELFGLDGPGDSHGTEVLVDEFGDPILNEQGNQIILSTNTDDMFGGVTLGIDPVAVQWLFDKRRIDGIGTDAYGPDASSDVNFDATYTTLDNDGIALVALANLDAVSVRGDVIIAPAVNLTDGSGFSVDPLACHGKKHEHDD